MPANTSATATKSSRRLRLVGVAALAASAIPAIGYVTTSAPSVGAVGSSVGGAVYRDSNLNGSKDGGEQPVASLWVKAFGHFRGADGVLNTRDDTETTFGPVRSSSDGSWSISGVSSDDKIRVEFYGLDLDSDGNMQASEETLPSWLQPGPMAVGVGSSVQFAVVNAIDVNFGVANPAEYCQSNPDLVTSCMTLGSNTTYDRALVTTSSALGGAVVSQATSAQVGAVNGIAYRRDGNIFAATYVKRHTEYGSAGATNAIYRTVKGSNTPSVFATLPGALTPHESAKYISDDNEWSQVGKSGIGDVDISEDGSALYAVEMGSGQLYTVPINGSGGAATAGALSSVSIASPTGCLSPRPTGLAVKDGLVYVGGVCSAEGSTLANLDGYVMVYNPGTAPRVLDAQTIASNAFATNEVLRFNFGYPRKQQSCVDVNAVGCSQRPWVVWNDTNLYSDGPMISGLAFTNGDLVIGVRDRLGDKAGNNAEQFGTDIQYQAATEGDLLLACRQSSGWALESNGACTSATNGSLTGAGVNNQQGPGGGEFFDDFAAINSPTNGDTDTASGSVSAVGRTVFRTSIDPTNVSHTGGLNSASAVDGSRLNGLTLQPDDPSFFGKANGLGDLEALCNEAPLEIGNRVWVDANHDGIQNAGEVPLSNVTLKLYAADGTTLLGTTITDAQGVYVFTNVGGTPSNTDNLVDTLAPSTAYKIVVDTTQNSLAGYKLTVADKSDGSVLDNSDSDALPVGTDAVIMLTTGGAGANNHTYDVGFYKPYSLGNRVWIDTNDDSKIQASEVGVDNASVALLDSTGAAVLNDLGTAIATLTASGGYYRFDDLAPGQYRVKVTGPTGYVSSTSDSTDPNDDVDADSTTLLASDNGIGVANMATSQVVTLGGTPEPSGELDLVAGPNPQGVGIADNAANMTVDFGFVASTSSSTTSTPTSTTTSTSTTTTSPDSTTTTTLPGETTTTTTTLPAATTTTTFVAVVQETTTTTTLPAPTTTTTRPVATTTVPASTAPTTTAPPTTSVTTTTKPAVIGDCVWKDFNGNGKQEPNEKPLPGAVLILTTPQGSSLKAITDANCLYHFEDLPPGTYTVTVQSSSNPTNGPLARIVTVSAGQVYLDADFGFNQVGVKGVEIERPADLAVTGSPSSLIVSLALGLFGVGALVLSKKRRRGTHFG